MTAIETETSYSLQPGEVLASQYSAAELRRIRQEIYSVRLAQASFQLAHGDPEYPLYRSEGVYDIDELDAAIALAETKENGQDL